jgi:hypothetical protein
MTLPWLYGRSHDCRLLQIRGYKILRYEFSPMEYCPSDKYFATKLIVLGNFEVTPHFDLH